MRTSLLAAAVALGLQATAAAGPKLNWKYDGHAQLPEAAKEAKQTGKRLLVGLAGSPT